MIGAVLFDLDDTLFEQQQWLDGAWRAVASAAGAATRPEELYDALVAVAAEGSGRGRIIDRALERVGAPSSLVPELVRVFRSFDAGRLEPYPGVRDAVLRLRGVVRTGLVTDGDPPGQRAKVRAAGLDGLFDVVVISDELGRDRRKPNPAPFRRALNELKVDVDAVVHVGDHPVKDIRGAAAVGMRAVRVLTGEYRTWLSDPKPWFTVPTATDACELLLQRLM